MATDAPTIDQYSGLSHKSGMDPLDTDTGLDIGAPPGWVGDDAFTIRRLNAYVRLAAYRGNQARHFLRTDDDIQKREHREYGDPDVYVDRIAAGVLGDEPYFVIDDADTAIPNAPEIPDRPSLTPTGDPEVDARIAELVETAWRDRALGAVDRWEQLVASRPSLDTRQEWFDAWVDAEQVWPKLRRAETDAVGLGDAVLVIGWDPSKTDPTDPATLGRPTLVVHEPDAYHPVLTDNPGDDYPNVVHLAWGIVDADDVEYLRRQTYWLAPLGAPDQPLDPETVGLGQTTTYPYASAASQLACYFSDITYRVDALSKEDNLYTIPHATVTNGGTPETIAGPDGTPVPAVAVPTGGDYIPVVHIPNTMTGAHFGVSSLSRGLQLFDDLAVVDASRTRAAWLAGNPPVGMRGVSKADEFELLPGAVFGLGENGAFDVLDTSAAVAVLSELAGELLDRLSINLQIPAGLLGRVDAAEVPSGLALALSFTPFVQLVGLLRLIRAHKYALLLKMVQRHAIVGGTLTGPPESGRIEFGAFMPNDLPAAVELVVKLLQAKGISRQTALRILEAAGVPIADLDIELAGIRSEDTDGARNIADATEDVAAAANYLGVDLSTNQPAEETAPPAPVAGPGTPTPPPAPNAAPTPRLR